MLGSNLNARLTEIRANVKAALGTIPPLELSASRGGAVDLGPLEDSLRKAVREVGRLRNTTDDPRPEQAEWWECGDCRAKLAAVSGLTITIVRKDLTVYVARSPGVVVIVACPRCQQEQQFARSEVV